MAILTLGNKTLIVNNATDFPLRFFHELGAAGSGVYNLIETDDILTATSIITEGTGYNPDPDGIMADPDAGGAGTAIAIADVDLMKVEGFGDFLKANLTGKLVGTRGIAGVKQVSSITAATGAQITVVAPAAATQVYFEIEVKSLNKELEFGQWAEQYGKVKRFQIPVTASSTASTILAALHAQIQVERDDDRFDLFQSTWSGTVFTLTGRDNGLYFTMKALDGDGYSSPVVTVLAPVVTTAAFEGTNTSSQLRDIRIETGVTNTPYGTEALELPIKGALYTSVQFSKVEQRKDLSGAAVVDSFPSTTQTFQIFIREVSTNDAYRLAMLNFLDAGTYTSKTYYKGTAAAPLTTAANVAAFVA